MQASRGSTASPRPRGGWLCGLAASLAIFAAATGWAADGIGDVQFSLGSTRAASGQNSTPLGFSLDNIPPGSLVDSFGFGVSFDAQKLTFLDWDLTLPGGPHRRYLLNHYVENGIASVILEVQCSSPVPFDGGEAVTLFFRPDVDFGGKPFVSVPVSLIPGGETWISLVGQPPLWPVEKLLNGAIEVYLQEGFSIGSASGIAGSEVEVPVVLTTLDWISSLSVGIDYDEEILEFLAAEPSDELSILGARVTKGWPEGSSEHGPAFSAIAPERSSLPYPRAEMPLAVLRFRIAGTAEGGRTYGILGRKIFLNGEETDAAFLTPGYVTVEESFRRGDANQDELRSVNASDAVAVLMYLFSQGEIKCPDAADVNDDGRIDLADPTGLLFYLFRSGAPPRSPFPEEGVDKTADQLGKCP